MTHKKKSQAEPSQTGPSGQQLTSPTQKEQIKQDAGDNSTDLENLLAQLLTKQQNSIQNGKLFD